MPLAAIRSEPAPLPAIPVLDVGRAIGAETLRLERPRALALLAEAAGPMPRRLVALADRVSRAWLVRSKNPYLADIDAVAATLGRPGAYFFNVHYEWGCTTGVKPGTAGTARLARVLDWRTPGLGRHIVAARIDGAAGPWVSLTWPGFAGVLQGMAPGRFSAALNQAPMATPLGVLPADWALNRGRVWRHRALPPAHLLRQVFETAPSYAEARRQLIETPICVPTIFTIAGLRAGEGAVIERRETSAHVLSGEACTANVWQSQDWRGRARGKENLERIAMLRGIAGAMPLDLSWLAPPVLNDTTRLALVADAAEGRLVARGYEADGAATAMLTLAL